MEEREEGNFADIAEMQFKKAFLPMWSTPSPITMCLIELEYDSQGGDTRS